MASPGSVWAGRRRAVCVLAASLWLAGCTNWFFYPMKKQILSPAQLGVAAADVRLAAADGVSLFAWHLTAEKPRGIVCYFHGNGENISTHIVNVSWLPAAGFEALLVDYRGYGHSAGRAEFPAVLLDVRAGLDWCVARGKQAGLPVYALGQSLGAALLLEVASMPTYRHTLTAVVADSGFSSYRRIARDALSSSWLLVPLQYPLSWLVTARHNPEDAVRHFAPLPLLVVHSPDDTLVPYAHGVRIFAAAQTEKCFLKTSGPHNAALGPRSPNGAQYREAIVEFFDVAVRASGTAFHCPAPTFDQPTDQ